MNKKGFQMTEIPTLVVVLLTIAIMLGVGATILGNVRDGDSETTTLSAFLANNTITVTNATTTTMNPASLVNDASGKVHLVSCSDMKAVNVTNSKKVTSQFTVTGCNVMLKNITLNGDSVRFNFTYVYNAYGNGYNTTQEGLDAQVEFSAWQSTFVVLIAAAVVIGLVGKYLFFG
jgi:Tfp pilus assembly protein FimT